MARKRAKLAGQSPLLSVEQAAALLDMGRTTLYVALRSPDCPLPVVRIGRTIKIPRAGLERLIGGDPVSGWTESASIVPALTEDGHCPSCGSSLPARIRPTCSAARRSSSCTAAV